MQISPTPAPCAALLNRVGGDEQVFTEVCDLFLLDAPKRLQDIRDALDARDAAALGRAAHAFRGAASVFDVSEIIDITRRLETLAVTGDLTAGDAAWIALETHGRALIETLRGFRLENVACRS